MRHARGKRGGARGHATERQHTAAAPAGGRLIPARGQARPPRQQTRPPRRHRLRLQQRRRRQRCQLSGTWSVAVTASRTASTAKSDRCGVLNKFCVAGLVASSGCDHRGRHRRRMRDRCLSSPSRRSNRPTHTWTAAPTPRPVTSTITGRGESVPRKPNERTQEGARESEDLVDAHTASAHTRNMCRAWHRRHGSASHRLATSGSGRRLSQVARAGRRRAARTEKIKKARPS